MKSYLLAGLALIGAALLAPCASASVITFDSAPVSSVSSYTESGVTFTAIGGGTSTFGPSSSPNGTPALLGDSGPRPSIRATITGGATFVSIDLGDFDADDDLLFLNIYDSSNVLLDSVTQFIDFTFTGMITLSLSNPNIAYAEFGSTAPSVNGSSVYADNFTFDQVPEPGTLALIGAALMSLFGLGLMRRRADA